MQKVTRSGLLALGILFICAVALSRYGGLGWPKPPQATETRGDSIQQGLDQFVAVAVDTSGQAGWQIIDKERDLCSK